MRVSELLLSALAFAITALLAAIVMRRYDVGSAGAFVYPFVLSETVRKTVLGVRGLRR